MNTCPDALNPVKDVAEVRASLRSRRLLFAAVVAAVAPLGLVVVPPAAAQQIPESPAPPASLEAPAATGEATTAASDAPQPPAPGRKRRFPLLGPQYSVYRPGTAKTASRFGDTWTMFSLALGGVDRRKPGLQTDFDTGFLTASSGKNRVTVLPVGLGARYTRPLGRGDVSLYAGGAANFYGVQMRVESDGIRNGWRSATGGSAFFGAHLGSRAFTEVRYYNTTRVRGLDLSGINYSAGIRF